MRVVGAASLLLVVAASLEGARTGLGESSRGEEVD
jgi:hypothetical protein